MHPSSTRPLPTRSSTRRASGWQRVPNRATAACALAPPGLANALVCSATPDGQLRPFRLLRLAARCPRASPAKCWCLSRVPGSAPTGKRPPRPSHARFWPVDRPHRVWGSKARCLACSGADAWESSPTHHNKRRECAPSPWCRCPWPVDTNDRPLRLQSPHWSRPVCSLHAGG